MYIVILSFFGASYSDDRSGIYLEKADSPTQAKSQARARLDYVGDGKSFDEENGHILDAQVKEVSEANLGLVFMED